MSLICWQTGSWKTGSGVGAITIVIDAESGATPLLAEIDTFTKVFKPFLSLFFCQSDTFCVANIYLQKSADTILFSELSPQSKQRASCQCGVLWLRCAWIASLLFQMQRQNDGSIYLLTNIVILIFL